MKTAISIPDAVFQNAERLARRLARSRSQLYSEAIAEYVARHTSDAITEALDAVYAVDVQPDPFVSASTRRVLARSKW